MEEWEIINGFSNVEIIHRVTAHWFLVFSHSTLSAEQMDICVMRCLRTQSFHRDHHQVSKFIYLILTLWVYHV